MRTRLLIKILIKTNPHEPLFEPDNFKSLTTAFAGLLECVPGMMTKLVNDYQNP